jgi:hypothetical protein
MRHQYIEKGAVVNMFNAHETPIYRDRNSGPIHSMLTLQNNSKTCPKDQMMLVYASLNIVAYIQKNVILITLEQSHPQYIQCSSFKIIPKLVPKIK